MSFQHPQNIPSFSSSQRPLEDSYWRASAARSNGGLGGYGLSQSTESDTSASAKLNNFFGGGRDLPMYKDKPYFQPRRTAPSRAGKRILYIFFGLFAIAFLYVFWGTWRSPRTIVSAGGTEEDLWKWVQNLDAEESKTSKKIDWEDRRRKVKDVFVVSWDNYEKYGWGRCIH